MRHCNATVMGKRCDFTADDLAEHALETGHSLCVVCCRSLGFGELRVCVKCVQQARDDLRLIAATFPRLSEIVEQSGYYGLAIDVLALSADGSVASPQHPDGYTHPVVSVATAHVERPVIPGRETQVTWWELDRATDTWAERTFMVSTEHPGYVEERRTPDGREHVRDHWPSDPTPVIAVLEANERDWRHTFGHGPAVDLATVAGCARYLLTWLQLAARAHPAFEEFAGEVRELAVKLAHTTGTADDPVVAPARCFDCGGVLISPYRAPVDDRIPARRLVFGRRGEPFEGREMAPVRLDPVTGEPDDPEPIWECSKCLAVYDGPSYRLAMRAAIEAQAAIAG